MYIYFIYNVYMYDESHPSVSVTCAEIWKRHTPFQLHNYTVYAFLEASCHSVLTELNLTFHHENLPK